MQQDPIIIIGAGACGLMAARELLKAGKKVSILEARDRIGGRIHTLKDNDFSVPLELGAEFIHGELPVTLQLLKEAGIKYIPMQGSTWQMRNGEISDGPSFFADWGLLEKKLKELKEDISIADFIVRYFNEEKYAALRKSITGFAEGYDAADTTRASTFALRDEWLSEEDSPQYRVKGGYGKMIDFLSTECLKMGGSLHLNAIVKEILWKKNVAEIISNDGRHFSANKVIITVPLGVLQQPSSGKSSISFFPDLPEKSAAIARMGFGSVIKVLLEFNEAFWRSDNIKKEFGKTADDVSFLISEATIPTWWTQLPQRQAILTGWLAGPASEKWKEATDEVTVNTALNSLSSIFQLNEPELREKMTAWKVANWNADPFALGAYAYSTLDTQHSIDILNEPVEDTLFFAGEALYNGPAMGTVEAALTSGINVSKKVWRLDDNPQQDNRSSSKL